MSEETKRETKKIEKPGEEVKVTELSVDDLEQIAGGAAAAHVKVLDKTAQATAGRIWKDAL